MNKKIEKTTKEQPVLTKEQKVLIKQKDEAIKKILNILNESNFDVLQAQRNIEVFKNTIQQGFFNFKNKKVKEVKLKIIKEEEDNNYSKYHSDMLNVLNPLPIFIAESILDDFLQAINGSMQKKKTEITFKSLAIKAEKHKK